MKRWIRLLGVSGGMKLLAAEDFGLSGIRLEFQGLPL